MIRVSVFTPVRVFGEGLAASLAMFDDVSVCGVILAADVLAKHLAPGVPEVLLVDVSSQQAVIDARLVGERWPGIALVALGLADDPDNVVSCAKAGFSAYVPADAALVDLHRILRATVEGEFLCSSRAAAALVREIRNTDWGHAPSTTETSTLTTREREIMALIARGRSNKEIARELALSVATVKNHVHHVLAKLAVARRCEVVDRLRLEPWRLTSG